MSSAFWRASFSVSKFSLGDSEIQVFLVNALLSYWYLLAGSKISRVHVLFVSCHNWVQVWDQDSKCRGRSTAFHAQVTGADPEACTTGAYQQSIFNVIVFLNETLSQVAFKTQVVESLQATFSWNNSWSHTYYVCCLRRGPLESVS